MPVSSHNRQAHFFWSRSKGLQNIVSEFSMIRFDSRLSTHFLAAALLAGCLGGSSAMAANESITWSDPTPVTSVQQIDTNGTLVHAGRWGGKTVVVHAGGDLITFTGRKITSDGSSSALATTSGQGVYTGAFSGSTGNAKFNSVLDSFAYDGPNPRVLELRGLIVGHSYEVQVFALDDRDLINKDHRPGTRVVRLGDQSDFKGNNSKQFMMKDNDSVIGRFVATGPKVLVYEDEMNPKDHSGNINAYVLRDVTKK